MSRSAAQTSSSSHGAKSVLWQGVPLFVGWGLVLLLWRAQAPDWLLFLVVLAQVGAGLAGGLGVFASRSARVGLALTILFLLGLILLPLLAVSTSPHEPDPVWRVSSSGAVTEEDP